MKVLLLFVWFIVLGFNSVYASESKMFKASLTNLTKGQVMTPPVWVVHQPSFALFTLGEEASEGLKRQARDGKVELLVEELGSANGVIRTIVGGGPIMPGQTQEVVFSGSPNDRLSVASMLASTNDAFASHRGLPLNPSSVKKSGKKQVIFLYAYDAGAETNNESCDYIPGPPCGQEHVDTIGNEGFVHFHPGLDLLGDLDSSHTFAGIAARVSIERIK